MDQKLRDSIRAEVREALTSIYTKMNERYVSADELCEHFAMITPSILKYHGDIFPRKKIQLTGTNGKTYTTHYGYALHQIALNIANGVYDDLKVFKQL